jgi:serine/threonine-protein kinase
MKKAKITVAALMVVLLTSGSLIGCGGVKVEGSGNLINETFEFSDFTEVKVENGFQVEVTQSSTFRVEITVDDNVLEHIEVSKSGNTLRIKPKSNRLFRSVTMRATITMPDLYKIELSGGSEADIAGFNSSHELSVSLSGGSHMNSLRSPSDITAGDADFNLSGGSHVTLSGITVGDAGFNLSGGSHVTLSGSADNLDVKGSGGSHFNLEDFSVSNADVNLSGGSHATVNVDGTLDVNLSGGSHVTYIDNPTLGDIDVSWDSTISSK